jgi:POT family proton-dependent oligopeptide transporter
MSHGVDEEKVSGIISPENDSKQGGADTSQITEADNETRSAIDEASPSKEVDLALRHVSDRIPWAAWLVVAFSSAERFSYFAFTGPLRKCVVLALSKCRQLMWPSENYIENPMHDALRPGALGLGQSKATALNCFLNILTYSTTIPAAMVADGYLGPFKLVCYSTLVYLSGLLLLFLTSLPMSLSAGAGLGGLIGALILIGLGVGGIKSSVSPFLGMSSPRFPRARCESADKRLQKRTSSVELLPTRRRSRTLNESLWTVTSQ